MAKHEQWPEALARYVQADSSLVLRPQGLIPGQLPIIVVFGIVAVVAVIGVAAFPAERMASSALLIASLVVLCVPASQLARWTRIRREADAWNIDHGVWRWKRESHRVPFTEIQTALVVKDEKGYRLEFPVYEHVRIAFVAKPFNEPAPSVEIAELFRLQHGELETLAMTLTEAASKQQ